MTPEQEKYYILGLRAAQHEIEMEIECCEMELKDDSLVTARYALRNGLSLINDMIEMTENGL